MLYFLNLSICCCAPKTKYTIYYVTVWVFFPTLVIHFHSCLKPGGPLTQLTGRVTNLPVFIRLSPFPWNESRFFKCIGSGSACVSGIGRVLHHLRATGFFQLLEQIRTLWASIQKGSEGPETHTENQAEQVTVSEKEFSRSPGGCGFICQLIDFFFAQHSLF